VGKTRLVTAPIDKARTRYRLAPSKISVPLVWLGRLIIPFYLHFMLKFRKIEIRNLKQIVEALRDFQENRTRLIVAFRHPYGDEAQLLFHVFENLVPRYARQSGKPLARRPGLRIVHDYAVALWGDAFIRFILPRSGAMPIYHIKSDYKSLKYIRTALSDDPFPVGLAPEGQISYHSETLPRIEQGTIRMGFWCANDIAKSFRSEKVLVLPLSVHYQYDVKDLKKILSTLDRIEAYCGFDARSGSVGNTGLSNLQPRIEAIESHILGIIEGFYAATYGYKPQIMPVTAESEAVTRQNRWRTLQPFALDIAEHALGIDPKGDDSVQRMYRIRLEGWDRIYPECPIEQLSMLEAALADRRAGEAWFAMRHMELVDLMSYHDVEYLNGGKTAEPSFDRIVETVINLQDLVFRLMGGNITNRPNIIRKKAVLVPGTCIDLTASLPDYLKDPKTTARALTDELARRFTDCIKVYQNEKES
jgi:hypothetical protein